MLHGGESMGFRPGQELQGTKNLETEAMVDVAKFLARKENGGEAVPQEINDGNTTDKEITIDADLPPGTDDEYAEISIKDGEDDGVANDNGSSGEDSGSEAA